MHEKHLMDHLIHKIVEISQKEGATKVTKVSVWLGAFSHMSTAHFKEHFDLAAQGTIAEGADIESEESNEFQHPNAAIVILKSIQCE